MEFIGRWIGAGGRSLHVALGPTRLVLALALSACGGAPAERASAMGQASQGPSAAAPAGATVSVGAAARPEAPLQSLASTPGPQPSVPGSYTLVILNDTAVHRDDDELAPSQGAGYRTLRAFVYQSGQPRSRSPVAGVKPSCVTPSQCEYLPPRKSGRPEKYTITLGDDSVATLSANEDLVTIRAKLLELESPRKVTVTLTMPGLQPVTRQITYAKARG